jgi:FMN phosphatase YigB (HAD superfamily)
VTEQWPLIDPAPRVVIFDLDDTLCDYSTARALRLRIAFTKALAGRRTNENSPDIERLIENSILLQPHGTDHFADLLAPYGVDALSAASSAAWFRANRFYGLQLFPEVVTVLDSLRGSRSDGGLGRIDAVGIVTNGPKDVQRAKLEHLGLSSLVDFVVISEEFGLAKPDPEIFLEALRLAGATAGEAVVVGDSPEFDIAGAQKTGIRSIWMNRSGLSWHTSRERPTLEIRSLSELPAVLGDRRQR